MKTFLFVFAGVSLAVAYVIGTQKRNAVSAPLAPVEDLAHKLQDAWADHHTVA